MKGEVLIDIAAALWSAAGLSALLVGLWALASPAGLLRANRALGRWVGPSGESPLDRSIGVECFFYRHHRLFGALLILAAVYSLYKVIFSLEREALAQALAALLPQAFTRTLVDAAFGYVYLIGLLAVVVGVILLVRPSALKSVEAWSNRWISTDALGRRLDASSDLLNAWVARQPRVFGAVAAVVGGVMLWVSGGW